MDMLSKGTAFISIIHIASTQLTMSQTDGQNGVSHIADRLKCAFNLLQSVQKQWNEKQHLQYPLQETQTCGSFGRKTVSLAPVPSGSVLNIMSMMWPSSVSKTM